MENFLIYLNDIDGVTGLEGFKEKQRKVDDTGFVGS